MTPEVFCTLGKHYVDPSQMRKPPPSCPSRRQCNECARTRQRERHQHKPPFDWASRFLERLDVIGDCWEWTGALARGGYGVTTVMGAQWASHRVSYFLHYGDLPADAFICHTCDNKPCCNPDHLYAGDVQTNSDDAVDRGRLDPPIGERNGHAILTAAQIPVIRAAYQAGHSQSSLGREYGVSSSAIHQVVRRKNWRHVA